MPYAGLVVSDPEIIYIYYNLLELNLSENDLLDKPSLIFNNDETDIPFDCSPPSVIARRGQKHPSSCWIWRQDKYNGVVIV